MTPPKVLNVFDMLASPSSYELVSDDNGVDYSTPPPWLDYTGRWGPKVSYKLKDPATAGVILAPIPFYLGTVVLGIIFKLPAEEFGEEGSEGPKMKSSWNGDEMV
nr:vacuolar protein sorting-associated protein 62 [Tanacetum cinerariifolium]